MKKHARSKAVAIHCPPFLQKLGIALYGDEQRTYVTLVSAFAVMGIGVWIANITQHYAGLGVCGG